MTRGVSRNGPGGYIIRSRTWTARPPSRSTPTRRRCSSSASTSRDATGRLVRTPEHGRKELFDATIGADSVDLTPAG